MKDHKKRNIVWTTIFLATLLLSLAAVAQAQSEGTCTSASVTGMWAWTQTGTIITPNGPVPFSAVGITFRDNDGNISGTTTRSTGGIIGQYTVEGTGTVNPDCTGTSNVRLYDQSGNLFLTAELASVYADNSTVKYELTTSSVRADGTEVPVVVLLQGKKVFPQQGK